MAENEFPKKLTTANIDDSIKGLYVVLWRNRGKQAAKIIGTEKEGDDLRVVFELVTEPDKGKVCTAKYDNTQEVVVYDEDTLALAVFDK